MSLSVSNSFDVVNSDCRKSLSREIEVRALVTDKSQNFFVEDLARFKKMLAKLDKSIPSPPEIYKTKHPQKIDAGSQIN